MSHYGEAADANQFCLLMQYIPLPQGSIKINTQIHFHHISQLFLTAVNEHFVHTKLDEESKIERHQSTLERGICVFESWGNLERLGELREHLQYFWRPSDLTGRFCRRQTFSPMASLRQTQLTETHCTVTFCLTLTQTPSLPYQSCRLFKVPHLTEAMPFDMWNTGR